MSTQDFINMMILELRALQFEEEPDDYSKLTNNEDRIKYAFRYIYQHDVLPVMVCLRKTLTKANELLHAGNNSSDKPWKLAYELYTEAIVSAPIDSAQLSMAYGCRAGILSNAGYYEDALLDIERAFKIGYPDSIMASMYGLRAICFAALKGKTSPEVEHDMALAYKLLDKMIDSHRLGTKVLLDGFRKRTFIESAVKIDYNEFMPDASGDNPIILRATEAIEFKYTKRSGRQVFATRDIPAGEALITQNVYASIPHYISQISEDIRQESCEEKIYLKYCWYCTKRVWSGVPCNHCIYVIYCDEECRDVAWTEYHDIECNVISIMRCAKMESPWPMALRMTIKAFKEAGSFQALKEKIQQIDSNTDQLTKGFDGGVYDDTKYASVYILPRQSEVKKIPFGHVLLSAFITCCIALHTPLLGDRLEAFPDIVNHEWSNFLGSLILTNADICERNAVAALITDNEGRAGVPKGRLLIPFLCLLNHSCDPTVIDYCAGDKNPLITLQRIRKGEQIFVQFGTYYREVSPLNRRAATYEMYNFECMCKACLNDWGPNTKFPSWRKQEMSRKVRQKLSSLALEYKRCSNFKAFEISMDEIPKVYKSLMNLLNTYGEFVKYPCEEMVTLKHLLYIIITRMSR